MDPIFAQRVRTASSLGSASTSLSNSPFASTSSLTLDSSVQSHLDDPFQALKSSPKSPRKGKERVYSDR